MYLLYTKIHAFTIKCAILSPICLTINVSFKLLMPTRVYHLYGDKYNHTYALYYSVDIEYFGREHLPYGILAIVMLCVFVILPVSILALYPFAFFQKFLNLFPARWYILHTFVDSFQGCYKDGTEPGTRDCRWFSAFFLLTRCFFLVVYGIIGRASYFPLCSLFLLCMILLLVVVQPYKSHFAIHYKTNATFTILYTFFSVIASTIDVDSPQNFVLMTLVFLFLVSLPSCFIVGLILHARFWCCLRLARRLYWWRRGYVAMGGDGDDADAYCDRVENPQAYPSLPAGQMLNCSSMAIRD